MDLIYVMNRRNKRRLEAIKRYEMESVKRRRVEEINGESREPELSDDANLQNNDEDDDDDDDDEEDDDYDDDEDDEGDDNDDYDHQDDDEENEEPPQIIEGDPEDPVPPADLIEPNNGHGLEEALLMWMLLFNVSRRATTELLKILKTWCNDHPEVMLLPHDSRSMFHTKTDAIITTDTDMNGDTYTWAKLKFNQYMRKFLQECQEKGIEIPPVIELVLNVDGVSPWRSSKYSFWTVLVQCFNLSRRVILPAGLYYGKGKPEDHLFINQAFRQLADLLEHGLEGFEGVAFRMRAVICDMPAKSFVKQIHYFNYQGGPCDKCDVLGYRLGRSMLIRPTLTWNLWSNEEFRLLNCANQMRESEFFRVFQHLDIDMIKTFLTDGMHQLYLGVVKLFLEKVKVYLQRVGLLEEVDAFIKQCGQEIPNDVFERKPRPLKDLHLWKASELRQFVLYLGPVVFQRLESTMYNLFLLLHIFASILETRNVSQDLLNYGQQAYLEFLKRCSTRFGEEFLVPNTHFCLHLIADVQMFGPLTENSAFMFENFNSTFGKYIKGRKNPMLEFIQRYEERVGITFFEKKRGRLPNRFVKDNFLFIPKHPRRFGVDVETTVKVYGPLTELYGEPYLSSTHLGIYKVLDNVIEERVENTDSLLRMRQAITIRNGNSLAVIKLRHRQ